MSLTLSHCLPTDAPELARLSLAIWSPIPRQIVTFGNVPEPQLLKMYEKEFYESMTSQKTYTRPQQKHHLKVTDDVTGEIAACGIWVYLPEGYCVEDDEEVMTGPLPDGANEDLNRAYCKILGETRSQPPRAHEPHWLLLLLGTHPDHERKGAGAQLIRWAFPHADTAGLKCHVEGSTLGHALYRKCGFEDVAGTGMELDLESFEGGLGMGWQRWVGMVRSVGRG